MILYHRSIRSSFRSIKLQWSTNSKYHTKYHTGTEAEMFLNGIEDFCLCFAIINASSIHKKIYIIGGFWFAVIFLLWTWAVVLNLFCIRGPFLDPPGTSLRSFSSNLAQISYNRHLSCATDNCMLVINSNRITFLENNSILFM